MPIRGEMHCIYPELAYFCGAIPFKGTAESQRGADYFSSSAT